MPFVRAPLGVVLVLATVAAAGVPFALAYDDDDMAAVFARDGYTADDTGYTNDADYTGYADDYDVDARIDVVLYERAPRALRLIIAGTALGFVAMLFATVANALRIHRLERRLAAVAVAEHAPLEATVAKA